MMSGPGLEYMIIADTRRLILRELTPDDAQTLYDIYREPDVMRFMGPPPASAEVERRNIHAHIPNAYRQHGFGLWTVVQTETGQVIGRCGLLRFDLHNQPQTEISYLLSRQYWGKGYATEAAAAVVRVAFDMMGIDRLFAVIMPFNHASMRVAERLGFGAEGMIEYKQFGQVNLYAKYRDGGAPADSMGTAD